MPKLTLQQIQFINNYLENNSIRYVDIRHEMTDHIAAALEEQEGDFYENFRLYMLDNKKEFINSNRYFRKLARKKAFDILKNNFLKRPFWIITLILFTVAMVAKQYIADEETITDALELLVIITSSVIYFSFLCYWLFKRDLHSVITKLLTIVYFGSIIFRFDRMMHNNTVMLFYYSFTTAFFVLLIQSVWQLNQQYKFRYNG